MSPAGGKLLMMPTFKACVRQGRLLLDEPTDLPDGEVIYLKPVDTAVDLEADDLEGSEREALHQALDEGVAAARAGDNVDAEHFVRELLARK
jgi:hypothetical protein